MGIRSVSKYPGVRKRRLAEPRHFHRPDAAPHRERRETRVRSGRHTRQRADVREHPLVEPGTRSDRAVFLAREHRPQREYAAGIEAGIHVLHPFEGADEQARGDEQEDG